ncbi:MAG: LptF/LptG family permease [Endomicrobiales bacterium]|jgi:LPS export ABC transporter permease LptF
MKIIHRYIIREFIEASLFGLIVFSTILLLDQVFQLIDLILSKHVSFFIVAKLFLLVLPNIFSLTIPMATLFGILLAFGRLSGDNEITALRATGSSYGAFTIPVLIAAAVLSLSLVYFNQVLSPQTHKNFRKMYTEILTTTPLIRFEEKTLTTIGDYHLYVKRTDPATSVLHGINIYKFSNEEVGVPWRIAASSGTVTVTPQAVILTLHNGYWQKPNPSRPGDLINMTFRTYLFPIAIGDKVMPTSQSLREMTFNELRQEIKKYQLNKMPTYFLENELWLRFVLAIAPLMFAIIAVPLGIITEKGAKSIGFGMSLLILFGFYILLVTSMNISENGYIKPQYILWMPHIIMGATGVYLWKKMLRK